MSSSTRYFIYGLVLLLPFVLLVHLNSHLEMERFQATHDIVFDDDQLLPSSEEIAAWSLNYTTAATDFLWLGAIFYSSERRQMRHPRRGFTEYADRIIDLDPHFHPIYYNHYSIRYELAVNPGPDDLDAANRILSTGLDHFPDDWRLARALVLTHISPGMPRDDEQRIADAEKAIYFAQQGAEAPGAPPEMTGLVVSARNRRNRLRQQAEDESIGDLHDQASDEEIDFFIRQFFSAENDSERRAIRNQLLQMGAEAELVERTVEYEKKLHALHFAHYRYLPLNLFLLVDNNLYKNSTSSSHITPAH